MKDRPDFVYTQGLLSPPPLLVLVPWTISIQCCCFGFVRSTSTSCQLQRPLSRFSLDTTCSTDQKQGREHAGLGYFLPTHMRSIRRQAAPKTQTGSKKNNDCKHKHTHLFNHEDARQNPTQTNPIHLITGHPSQHPSLATPSRGIETRAHKGNNQA